MKLTEKIIDSTTGLKMRSGSIVEIHVIQNEQNDERSLVITHDEGKLELDHQDITKFINFFKKFLENF